MTQIAHELIRQVQISTRAAAGLSDYNPSDPTLPALPPLAAAIAASDPSPPPHLRCRNCRGALLRGSQSIVCVYCGFGPHYDAVPDPISFTSTVGYQWLIRSLRLDGSEMVDPTNKSEQDQMQQRSPKALTPLSEFLNLKIPWPVETEKEANTSSDKHLEESKRSVSLPGVAPDKFFSNFKRDFVSDMSIEQPIKNSLNGTADSKDFAALDIQNFFQNVQSSEPAGSSSNHKTGEAFSEWQADFQSGDSENQQSGDKSSDHFAGSSTDSGNKLQDPSSSDRSISLEVDLAAQIDSVFGPGKDPTDEKPKDTPAVSPAFDDWNSDDMWNTLSSIPQFSGGFDSTVSTKNDQEGDCTLEYSYDLSTSDDLFQDFQSPTDYPDMTEHKVKNEEHKTMDEDLFEEWNDFTGPTSSQAPFENAWTEGGYQVSTSEQKSSEMDLFSFDNKFGGDFGSSSEPNLFSTSTSYSNAPTEPIMAENPASNWLSDTSNPSHERGQAAKNGDATKDDVTMLISQMHDLSFMLEPNLCIPSESDTHNPSPKD